MEALSDPSSGLTYPALTGARKQSVVDAERLFNHDLQAFMLKKGYLCEANYIERVLNWQKACDERGLQVQLPISQLDSDHVYCVLSSRAHNNHMVSMDTTTLCLN